MHTFRLYSTVVKLREFWPKRAFQINSSNSRIYIYSLPKVWFLSHYQNCSIHLYLTACIPSFHSSNISVSFKMLSLATSFLTELYYTAPPYISCSPLLLTCLFLGPAVYSVLPIFPRGANLHLSDHSTHLELFNFRLELANSLLLLASRLFSYITCATCTKFAWLPCVTPRCNAFLSDFIL